MAPSPNYSDIDNAVIHRVRQRTSKACDRCRIKKAKCDGEKPCDRCSADNTICSFGHKRKVPNKAYPKGYVEMLEEQQRWLVHGLQVLYQMALNGDSWHNAPLEHNKAGRLLTHDLLARLGSLDPASSQFVEIGDPIQQVESEPQPGDELPGQGLVDDYSESPVFDPSLSSSNNQTSLSTSPSNRSEPQTMDTPYYWHNQDSPDLGITSPRFPLQEWPIDEVSPWGLPIWSGNDDMTNAPCDNFEAIPISIDNSIPMPWGSSGSMDTGIYYYQ